MNQNSASRPPAQTPTLPRRTGILALERLRRTIRLGFKSLWLHRLRSLLTVLGIVFGVCSVIAMLAIGEGASYVAQEQIKTMGSQNIIITSMKPSEEQKITDKNRQSFMLEYGLTEGDLMRIRDTIPGVTVVIPGRSMRENVWNNRNRVECEILGTIPWYPQMRGQRLAQGRFFTDNEMAGRSSVCVIGSEVVDKIFPLEQPLGSCVRVGEEYYRVIGIMEARSKTLKTDQGAEPSKPTSAYRMFIPLSTARMRFGDVIFKRRAGAMQIEKVSLHEITVKVDRLEDVRDVSEGIKALLERNHKKKDYEITVPLELLKRAEKMKDIFNIVLGSIAAISLLVGGIGIMNIMLASVTERTREIGVRRALGARRGDIINQFLVETIILSGTGGLIGVILGMLIPLIVTRFAGMMTIVTFWSPILAFSISGVVGIIFGIYPAFRAAKMDPVEALRHA